MEIRMGRYKQFLKFTTLGFLTLVLAVLAAGIYGEPRHPISVFVFKVGYFASLDKANYLKFYSPQQRVVGAGYLPEEVDSFLCNRIETTDSDSEFAGIVELYVLQAGGREGNCIFKTSSRTSEKIAENLVKKITSSSHASDLHGEIILLEEVRRGESLGKGKLGYSSISADRPSTAEQWQTWMFSKALPIARVAYNNWWSLNIPWEEKKNIS
ncbi:MAG: hypothetical protein ABR535_06820, partial [Pyrinomonadaceae bacterium]